MRAIITMLCGMALALSGAAWGWAADDVPAPPQGELRLKPLTLAIGSKDVQARVYVSSEDPQDILAFYREELPRHGWKPQGPSAEQLALVQQQSPDMKKFWDNYAKRSVFYVKDQEVILVAADNTQPSLPGTLVFVNRWSMPSSGKSERQERPSAAGQRQADASTAVPDTQYLPRYTGAVRMLATGDFQSGSSVRTYQTNDAPDAVIAFYDEVMPSLGWTETKRADRTQPVNYPSMNVSGTARQYTRQYHGHEGLCVLIIMGMAEGEPRQTVITMNYYRFKNQELLKAHGKHHKTP